MEPDAAETIPSLLSLLTRSAELKSELRHGWNADGTRAESVAEHCFQLGLFAMLVAPYLEHPVNVERLLKMCLVHDLPEIVTGDTPYVSEVDRLSKKHAEQAAMEELTGIMPSIVGTEVRELWLEFEAGDTVEAKCARALDGLEAQIQHNIAPIGTWEPREYGFVYTKMDSLCRYDSTLSAVCEAIKRVAENKMIDAGIDTDAIKPSE